MCVNKNKSVCTFISNWLLESIAMTKFIFIVKVPSCKIKASIQIFIIENFSNRVFSKFTIWINKCTLLFFYLIFIHVFFSIFSYLLFPPSVYFSIYISLILIRIYNVFQVFLSDFFFSSISIFLCTIILHPEGNFIVLLCIEESV